MNKGDLERILKLIDQDLYKVRNRLIDSDGVLESRRLLTAVEGLTMAVKELVEVQK